MADSGGTTVRRPRAVLLVSCGGVLGSLARYGLSAPFSPSQGDMPWATLGVNTSGCLLMGVLMTLLGERFAHRQQLHPFLGVGVLGGYTTFSAYTVQAQQATTAESPYVAVAYLVVTATSAMSAVVVGWLVTRAVLRRIRSGRSHGGGAPR